MVNLKFLYFSLNNFHFVLQLLHHTGTVTSLAFTPDGTHLITASEDGAMSAVRSGSWVVEKIWQRAHKGSAINHLTVHSSGKMALTLGKDLVIRTWNLVKGRQVYATNLNSKPSLGKVCEYVEWSTDGKHFCLTGAKVAEIWSAETASCAKTISCQSKPNCISWIDDCTVIIGMEDGNLMIAGINKDEDVIVKAYEKRVKAIKFLNGKLVTVCSTGEVTMWSVTSDNELEKMCSIEIGCRPICISLIETSDTTDEAELKEEIKVEDKTTEKKEKNFGRSVEIEVEGEEIGFKTPTKKKSNKRKNEVSNLLETPTSKIKKVESNSEPSEIDDTKKSSKKQKNKKMVEEEVHESSKKIKEEPKNILRSHKKKFEKRNFNVVSSPNVSPKADKKNAMSSAKKSKKASPKKNVHQGIVSDENVLKAENLTNKKLKNKSKAKDIGNVSLQEPTKDAKKSKNKNRKSMF